MNRRIRKKREATVVGDRVAPAPREGESALAWIARQPASFRVIADHPAAPNGVVDRRRTRRRALASARRWMQATGGTWECYGGGPWKVLFGDGAGHTLKVVRAVD